MAVMGVPFHGPIRVALAVAGAVLLVGLAGYAVGGSVTAPPASTAWHDPAATPVPTGTGTLPYDSRPTLRGSRVIAWLMEYAPGGLGAEQHLIAFSALSHGNCRSVVDMAAGLDEPFRSLYLAAGNACLAAFHDLPARWADAERAWSAVGADTGGYRCYDHDVRRMVSGLVDLHRRYPDLVLVRQVTARGAGTTRCPSFTAVSPDQGPVGGHQRVRLTGANLPARVTVVFGSELLTDVPVTGGREAVVETPPAAAPGTVDVDVRDAFYHTPARYTYLAEPASGAPATRPLVGGSAAASTPAAASMPAAAVDRPGPGA